MKNFVLGTTVMLVFLFSGCTSKFEQTLAKNSHIASNENIAQIVDNETSVMFQLNKDLNTINIVKIRDGHANLVGSADDSKDDVNKCLVVSRYSYQPCDNKSKLFSKGLLFTEIDKELVDKTGTIVNALAVEEYIKAQNSIETFENFIDNSKISPFAPRVKADLLKVYRNENSFRGYFRAYKITGSKEDLMNADKSAQTDAQHEIVEKALLKKVNFEKVFNINVNSDKSPLKEATSQGLLDSGKKVSRNFNNKISITLKKDSPLKLKYGTYKIKIKFNLDCKYSSNYGNMNENPELTAWFYLNSSNGYSYTNDVNFEDVVISGTYHSIAGTTLSFLGNIFGAKTKSTDFDVKYSLTDANVKYEILSIE